MNSFKICISFCNFIMSLKYQNVTRWSDYKTNRDKCGDTSGQQFIIVIKLVILLLKIKPAVKQTDSTRQDLSFSPNSKAVMWWQSTKQNEV